MTMWYTGNISSKELAVAKTPRQRDIQEHICVESKCRPRTSGCVFDLKHGLTTKNQILYLFIILHFHIVTLALFQDQQTPALLNIDGHEIKP